MLVSETIINYILFGMQVSAHRIAIVIFAPVLPRSRVEVTEVTKVNKLIQLTKVSMAL